jgi:hypothetical protein
MAPIICKNSSIFFKSDNVIENIQIQMSRVIFIFLVWKFAQIWNRIWKGNIWIFFRKNSLDVQKIENHTRTFSYWF